MKAIISIVSCCSIFCSVFPGVAVLAESLPLESSETSTIPAAEKRIALNDDLFLLNKRGVRADQVVVFNDIQGREVASNQIPSGIRAKVLRLSKIVIPSIELRGDASNAILGLVALAEEKPPVVSLDTVLPSPPSDVSAPKPAWLQALSLQDVSLDTSDVLRVPYLELLDRVAQVLDLEVGVLESGAIIFGSSGKWVKDATPSCTLRLSIRCPEDVVERVRSGK